MWPTPTSSSYGSSNNGCPGDGREAYATKGRPSLQRMAAALTPWPTREDARASGLMLNPRWIEALMGFPMGWCLLPTGQASLFDGPLDAGSLSTTGSHPAPCGATACPTMRPR